MNKYEFLETVDYIFIGVGINIAYKLDKVSMERLPVDNKDIVAMDNIISSASIPQNYSECTSLFVGYLHFLWLSERIDVRLLSGKTEKVSRYELLILPDKSFLHEEIDREYVRPLSHIQWNNVEMLHEIENVGIFLEKECSGDFKGSNNGDYEEVSEVYRTFDRTISLKSSSFDGNYCEYCGKYGCNDCTHYQ
jgi:hypothetical protein